MISIDPRRKFSENVAVVATGVVFILAGLAFTGVCISHASLVWHLFLPLPVSFTLFGFLIVGCRSDVLYDQERDEIFEVILMFRFSSRPIWQRKYPRTDFDSIVVEHADDENRWSMYTLVLYGNGKLRVELHYNSTEEKIREQGAALEKLLGLKLEDSILSSRPRTLNQGIEPRIAGVDPARPVS